MEVTNFDWGLYLSLQKNVDSVSYSTALPDSNLWKKAYPVSGFAFLGYEQRPATGKITGYENYPVVGITYDQAMDYCKWRSARIANKDKQGRKVICTLPSMEDYLKALSRSQGKKSKELYPAGGKLLTSMKTYRKVRPASEYRNDKDFYRLRHKPGLFVGICDNAHEMLAAKGKAVAGLQNDSCLSVIRYEAPSEHLGFRCKCTVE